MAGERRFAKLGAKLSDLEEAAADRLRDADVLSEGGRHDSAIAMGLYALEISLKTAICRRLDLDALPTEFQIHDFEGLLVLSGLSTRLRSPEAAAVKANWDFLTGNYQSAHVNELRYSRGQFSTEQVETHPRDTRRGPAMGLSPNMKRAVRRVADVLGAFARGSGWWPLDFRLYYRANEEWGRINFVFASDGFAKNDYIKNHRHIMAYLKDRLQDEPDLVDALNLSLRSMKELTEGGIYSVDRSYSFIRPRDLISRAVAGQRTNINICIQSIQLVEIESYFTSPRAGPRPRLGIPPENSKLICIRDSSTNLTSLALTNWKQAKPMRSIRARFQGGWNRASRIISHSPAQFECC